MLRCFVFRRWECEYVVLEGGIEFGVYRKIGRMRIAEPVDLLVLQDVFLSTCGVDGGVRIHGHANKIENETHTTFTLVSNLLR